MHHVRQVMRGDAWRMRALRDGFEMVDTDGPRGGWQASQASHGPHQRGGGSRRYNPGNTSDVPRQVVFRSQRRTTCRTHLGVGCVLYRADSDLDELTSLPCLAGRLRLQSIDLSMCWVSTGVQYGVHTGHITASNGGAHTPSRMSQGCNGGMSYGVRSTEYAVPKAQRIYLAYPS